MEKYEELKSQNFKSHAYDEPNTFGWMRTNERIGRAVASGASDEELKVLFVEEAQKVNVRTDNITEEQWRALPQFARNAFTEYSVKQMIEKAVKEGKDVVAWTTGEQQVDRYSDAITTQISGVRWESSEGIRDIDLKKVDGTQSLNMKVNSEGVVVDSFKDWNGKHLSGVVGKDMSEKILKQPQGSLEGEGLRIGGEDLRKFYDKNLPSTADKYIKKLDSGAKVEEFDLGVGQQDIPVTSSGDAERERRLERTLKGESPDIIKQQGFRITPAMREKVLKEGQPLSFNLPDKGSFPTVDAGTFTV